MTSVTENVVCVTLNKAFLEISVCTACIESVLTAEEVALVEFAVIAAPRSVAVLLVTSAPDAVLSKVID